MYKWYIDNAACAKKTAQWRSSAVDEQGFIYTDDMTCMHCTSMLQTKFCAGHSIRSLLIASRWLQGPRTVIDPKRVRVNEC